jgi:hypothetical protein
MRNVKSPRSGPVQETGIALRIGKNIETVRVPKMAGNRVRGRVHETVRVPRKGQHVIGKIPETVPRKGRHVTGKTLETVPRKEYHWTERVLETVQRKERSRLRGRALETAQGKQGKAQGVGAVGQLTTRKSLGTVPRTNPVARVESGQRIRGQNPRRRQSQGLDHGVGVEVVLVVTAPRLLHHHRQVPPHLKVEVVLAAGVRSY